jgi:hypothetical protein
MATLPRSDTLRKVKTEKNVPPLAPPPCTHNSFSFSSPSAFRLTSDNCADRSATAALVPAGAAAVGEVVLEAAPPYPRLADMLGAFRGMEPMGKGCVQRVRAQSGEGVTVVFTGSHALHT